jgi:hypothetical protein
MQYITDISRRGRADVTIKRGSAKVATVPITPGSTRRFMLMQEDFIQLVFSLAPPVNFAIGDYIDDELFGRFYVTSEQMPRYNQRTGGYDYSLRLDAPYMMWANWLHCLTVTVDGQAQRMESSWNLTDRLEAHARQIVDEVNLIVPPTETREVYDRVNNRYSKTSTAFVLNINAAKAAEVHHISYEGNNIIEALNMLAETWECEWWVTTDERVEVNTSGNHYVYYQNVLHFGRCEYGSAPYIMALNDNVESMDVSRDQQTYANRIYAFGGTQNIPSDYDRHLNFVADEVRGGTSIEMVMRDSNRKLKLSMINDVVDGQSTYVTNIIDMWNFTKDGLVGTLSPVSAATDTYKVRGIVSPTLTNNSDSTLQRVSFELRISGEVQKAEATHSGNTWTANFPVDVETDSLDITITAKYISAQLIPESNLVLDCIYRLSARGTGATAARNIEIVNAGRTYKAVLNPYNLAGTDDWSSFIGNINRDGTPIFADGEFDVDSDFTIPEKWLNLPNIPYSYFTPDYNGGVLSKVGENRLHLPTTNRYIEAEGLSDYANIVEEAVIFEDIYPKMSLKVASVTTEVKTDDVKYEDGSIRPENWSQYKFTVTKADGSPFEFNTRFIMDGGKLEACFTAPSTMQSSGFMLAGMRFEVGFDNSTQVYTIIRNDSYGVSIPNSAIYPQVGDTLFLAGWNPKAITDLNLVADAENELMTEAAAYLQAIQEGQFTITSHMMSTKMMRYPFCNDRTKFGLLGAGAKVTVNHAALPGGSKTSRVLGYEYKLDMPFDTPSYTIGETEASSRLKQIEKKLTKL